MAYLRCAHVCAGKRPSEARKRQKVKWLSGNSSAFYPPLSRKGVGDRIEQGLSLERWEVLEAGDPASLLPPEAFPGAKGGTQEAGIVEGRRWEREVGPENLGDCAAACWCAVGDLVPGGEERIIEVGGVPGEHDMAGERHQKSQERAVLSLSEFIAIEPPGGLACRREVGRIAVDEFLAGVGIVLEEGEGIGAEQRQPRACHAGHGEGSRRCGWTMPPLEAACIARKGDRRRHGATRV